MTGQPVPVPGGSQPQQPYMGEMAPMDSSHQTMMWQQNQYMVDSGIHSGSTTQAPSVSSKHGALESCEDIDVTQQMIYDFDRGYAHSGYPQDQINGTYEYLKYSVFSTFVIICMIKVENAKCKVGNFKVGDWDICIL